MRVQDVAALSTRMFKTNPSRTWLTILGMGVGTGAVVTLVGLGFGLQGIILEQIVFGETLLSLNVSNPPSLAVKLDDATVTTLRDFVEVKDVAPLASYPTLITLEGFTGNATLQGLSPAYYRYTGVKANAGELFTDDNVDESSDKVVVSQGLLKLFEIDDPESVIGKKATFRVFVPQEGGNPLEVPLPTQYEIIGVTNEELTLISSLTFDEFTSHFTVPFYERVQVRVLNSDLLGVTTDKIVEMGFSVTALSKTVDQANKIFQGIQAVLAVFGGIALTVSAIGMFNTMTVTLLERTGEIGIMRTIGASARDVMIMFISEAVVVGFLGGIVGILIGMAIGFGFNTMLAVAAGKFGGKAVSLFKFPLLFLLFIMAFSTVVGFLTGLFPARRAAKLNPLDAIRYK